MFLDGQWEPSRATTRRRATDARSCWHATRAFFTAPSGWKRSPLRTATWSKRTRISTGRMVQPMISRASAAGAGVDDLVLVHPSVGRARLQRLAAVSNRVNRLAVSLNTVDLARMLPRR
jgi:hypothetical protein